MNDSLWLNDELDDSGNPTGTVAYTARELRRAGSTHLAKSGTPDRFGARSGVHPAGGDPVFLDGTSIVVRDLTGVSYPGLSGLSGPYEVQLPSHTHFLAAGDGANDRRDIVVLRQYDNDEDASGRKEAVTEYITGTPGSNPSAPAVPSGADRLATIYVPAAGTGSAFVEAGPLYTVAAGGVLPVTDDSDLPGNSGGIYDGLVRWNRSSDELQVHNGQALWETVAGRKAPRGLMAYTATDADLTPAGGRDIYMSVTFTAEANRYYTVTTSLGFTSPNAGAAMGITPRWAPGSSVTPADNGIGSVQYAHTSTVGSEARISGIWVADTVTAGIVTVGLMLRTFAGEGATASEGQLKVTDEGGF